MASGLAGARMFMTHDKGRWKRKSTIKGGVMGAEGPGSPAEGTLQQP